MSAKRLVSILQLWWFRNWNTCISTLITLNHLGVIFFTPCPPYPPCLEETYPALNEPTTNAWEREWYDYMVHIENHNTTANIWRVKLLHTDWEKVRYIHLRYQENRFWRNVETFEGKGLEKPSPMLESHLGVNFPLDLLSKSLCYVC